MRIAGALALNRLIASLLFGVQPTDAPTLAMVIATIALVAALACWLKDFRASRLDPNVVLRADQELGFPTTNGLPVGSSQAV